MDDKERSHHRREICRPDAIPLAGREPSGRELRTHGRGTRESEETGKVQLFAAGDGRRGSRRQQGLGETGAGMQRPLENLAQHADVEGLHPKRMIGYQAVPFAWLTGLASRGQRAHGLAVELLEQVRGIERAGSGEQAAQREGRQRPEDGVAAHGPNPDRR
ncbi:MAG TPA: hypothetical protein VJO34_01935 [Methylomirabilota bacterium]|nr:hypothetical protein [Methylomirabilota bacterium]